MSAATTSGKKTSGVIVWRRNPATGIEVLIGQEGSKLENISETFDINTHIANEYKKRSSPDKKPANTGKNTSGKIVAGWNQLRKGHASAGAASTAVVPDAVATIGDAWSEFSARAAQIEVQKAMPVHFSQVVDNSKHNVWETIFSYQGTGKFGIIKGGCDKSESDENCARRELNEELNSYFLASDHLNPFYSFTIGTDTYTIYTIELDMVRSASLLSHIGTMYSNHYGEMYSLDFRKLSSVLMRGDLNRISQQALTEFATAHAPTPAATGAAAVTRAYVPPHMRGIHGITASTPGGAAAGAAAGAATGIHSASWRTGAAPATSSKGPWRKPGGARKSKKHHRRRRATTRHRK